MAKSKKEKPAAPPQKRLSINPERLVPMREVAHAFQVLTALLDWENECSSIAVSDLACLIDNKGSEVERAEAMLALVPIAERVADRRDAAHELRLAMNRK